MKRIALVMLIVALAASGCNDEKKADGQNASASDPAAAAAAAAAAGEAPGAPKSDDSDMGHDNHGGTTTTTPGVQPGSGTATTQPPPDPDVQMSVERACVRRGPTGDTQVLNVKTVPNDTVAWSTAYSDRSNEVSNPSYTTGSGKGKAGPDGRFRTEWKVPPNAPLGTATLLTIAKGKFGPRLTFEVVAEDGRC